MNRLTRTLAASLAVAAITSTTLLSPAAAQTNPVNDNFASPAALPAAAAGQHMATNAAATLEAGEAPIAGVGTSTVHYSIVAPTTGSMQVSTFGSDYDTVLAVGEGGSLPELTVLATNDDAQGTFQSQVTVNVVAGNTYRIIVGGYQGAQGAVHLSWQFTPTAAFDSFATPTILEPTLTGTIDGANAGATLEAGEAPIAGIGTNTVHYSVVSPVNGTVRVSTAGSDYDTVLAVGEGGSLAELTVLATNDDINDTRQSEVTVNVVAGNTYRIIVGGYQGATGGHTLSWTFEGEAPQPEQPRPEQPEPAVGVDQAAFVARLNEIRAEARTCMRGDVAEHMPAVGPVVLDPGLAQASQVHSQDMADNNFFDHTGSDGSSFVERAARFGTTAGGENISAWETMEQAFQSWLDSSMGHCQGLMNPDATRVGAGYAQHIGRTGNPGWANNWTMMTGG